MAHLHCSKSIVIEVPRIQFYSNVGFTIQSRTRLKNNYYTRGLVHCCTSSTSTTPNRKIESNGIFQNKKLQFGYLVSDDDDAASWQVRRMAEKEDEMRRVADVQAEAFHEPVFLFDDMFFDFFKAEVLAGLLYKLRNSPPDRYACLVAEQRSELLEETEQELVGVVDVTVMREDSVLRHLPGAQEYIYVSGIAVLNKFRRQKVATALLKACDKLSTIWGFDYLVLRAYEDDYGARKLYSNAGYRVVSGDPPWLTSWIGRRRRIVMVKGSYIQQ
ncbi:hypothetical protein ACP275_03G119100 [Erythranthe tilingii]